MYSKILVPVDGSENSFRALTHGLFIGSTVNSKLIVLYVIEIPPFAHIQSQKVVNSIIKSLEKDAKKVFDKVEFRARKYNLEYETVLLKGHSVASVILEYDEKNKIELIVIGSRGHGRIKTAILGSVSHHVFNHTKKPILVIK
jgi:nucleotide-binding universal stress UspA family protein